MKTITFTVTLAFTTNRRRKIFENENVTEEFELLCKQALQEKGICNIHIQILAGCSAVITADLPMGITPEQAAQTVKLATSKKIRNDFPEFSYMHALWTRKTWWAPGVPDENMLENIRQFINEQPHR